MELNWIEEAKMKDMISNQIISYHIQPGRRNKEIKNADTLNPPKNDARLLQIQHPEINIQEFTQK